MRALLGFPPLSLFLFLHVLLCSSLYHDNDDDEDLYNDDDDDDDDNLDADNAPMVCLRLPLRPWRQR